MNSREPLPRVVKILTRMDGYIPIGVEDGLDGFREPIKTCISLRSRKVECRDDTLAVRAFNGFDLLLPNAQKSTFGD